MRNRARGLYERRESSSSQMDTNVLLGETMELRSIETFLAIVEYGTFSRAAERLGYAQSAVTVQMRQLEQELGVRLFDRIPRGVRLTEQGRTFALHANEVAEAVSRARTAVELGDAPSQDVRGTIRLGSVESVSTALLPELLIAFHERCPHVQVVVTTDRREDMMAGLASNTIDMLLTMERHICLNGVVCEALREEHVVFLASPALLRAHGVEDGEPVGVDALGRLPFVLTERGESYRLELDRLLAERDVTIEPLVEAGNTETLVHLAERGVGATFVPRFSAANELASGTLVELGSDMSAVRMETQMLWHARKWIAPHLAEFIQVTRRFFAS